MGSKFISAFEEPILSWGLERLLSSPSAQLFPYLGCAAGTACLVAALHGTSAAASLGPGTQHTAHSTRRERQARGSSAQLLVPFAGIQCPAGACSTQ